MAAEPSVFQVIITATGPLSFSQRKPGGIFQESLGYVPGSALRGAVAGRLLPAGHDMGAGHDDGCAFCRRFDGEEAVVFTNAYPVVQARVGDGATVVAQVEERPRVLPATAVSCKAHSGFLGSGDAHGAFDTLLDRFCWEELSPAGLVYNPVCPKCAHRVDRFSGFYVEHNDHGPHSPHRHLRRVSQRLLTRVAINRRRGVAEDGMLYSPWVMVEAVEPDGPHAPPKDRRERAEERDWPPATFLATIAGADDHTVKSLIEITAVGGGSSQGLNQVQIRVVPASMESADVVRRRVEDFNRKLQWTWEGYRALGRQEGKPPEGLFFALTLQAEGIFRQDDGRPAVAPSEAELGLASTVSLVRCETATSYGGGWNAAWGLPKPAELRVAMGGVYLFHAPQGLTADDYGALARCQVYGIGRRRAEGFGQVRVCDEFHLTTWDEIAAASPGRDEH